MKTRKCLLWLNARKFSSVNIFTFQQSENVTRGDKLVENETKKFEAEKKCMASNIGLKQISLQLKYPVSQNVLPCDGYLLNLFQSVMTFNRL